jgi:hypothetical protein
MSTTCVPLREEILASPLTPTGEIEQLIKRLGLSERAVLALKAYNLSDEELLDELKSNSSEVLESTKFFETPQALAEDLSIAECADGTFEIVDGLGAVRASRLEDHAIATAVCALLECDTLALYEHAIEMHCNPAQ